LVLADLLEHIAIVGVLHNDASEVSIQAYQREVEGSSKKACL